MAERIGLIAGNGRFPLLVLEEARKQGLDVVVAAIQEETFSEIEHYAAEVHWMSIGQLGRLVDTFKQARVRRALMAGQVKHARIFSGALPDWRMVKLLKSLKQKNTDALLGGVARVLAEEGIELLDSTAFLKHLLPEAGVLTRRKPDAAEQADFEYGRSVARQIAGLDLGQALAVKDRAVVAIEAMEGTDAVIQRAGELTRGGFVVVKVSKPNQDMRFDVPVIGVPTIEGMHRFGGTALAIDAGKTLLIDRDPLLHLADQYEIAIQAFE
ncbi:MAG: UDP-2,3-diacylglucosamine diphosphatase LpxI [Acidobacteria bacterium]|nr:UDP-2,3-diacylglucosamine diphosphatase LpxI [Acidobacteriota bacterium]